MLEAVTSHYSSERLIERIFEALERLGRDPSMLVPEDLAPIDEFHIRGRQATEELYERAGFEPGSRLLDVGCGLGGPARFLAARGHRVTGVDVTASLCEAVRRLNKATSLADGITIVKGNALELPFLAESFDGAWCIHANMNLWPKAALFREISRVLRPKGRIALYEVVRGDGGAPVYPVPWARSAEGSALCSDLELRGAMEESGFSIQDWQDVTPPALEWMERAWRKSKEAGRAELGLHLLFGVLWEEMVENVFINLAEGRVRVVMGAASLL